MFLLLFSSCSPTERFTKKEEEKKIPLTEVKELEVADLRILINEVKPDESLIFGSSVYLYDESSKLRLIPAGSKVSCYANDRNLLLDVNDQRYYSNKYVFAPVDGNEEFIKFNGRNYRGRIQISLSGNTVHLINIVNMEDYVRGVLPKEMPLGKNNENFEALKALAICIRTYALKKFQDGKIYFDLYSDTRDQVYGGVDSEHPLSNEAVDETKNLILKFNNKPALLYYHSTCGGYTEASENVFTTDPIPYLSCIEDGNESYCKISPRFQWNETYDKKEIIKRLKEYSLLNIDEYIIKDVSIDDRFESGRVSKLVIAVEDFDGNERELILHGNEIRSILRTADNKNILWSTLFDVSLTSEKVIMTGKGYGHGVGLCQWGAIALSRMGRNFKYILDHYYPGTIIESIND